MTAPIENVTENVPTYSGIFGKSSKADNPKRAYLPTLRAPGRKGANGPQGAAGRLQGVFSLTFFWDTTFDQYFVDLLLE